MMSHALAVQDNQQGLTRYDDARGNNGHDGGRTTRRVHFGTIVGECASMRRIYEMIARVAQTDATVLITGESGTGKELVAQAIHRNGPRRQAPCVVINCGSVPETLIDSELFGHEAGSFTGATRTRSGLFERAHGGTLFLDEVAEMPLALQTRLLRVLETGLLRHVGGEREIEVDVRVIAATNRDPICAVAENKLREDLLYRLAVFPIAMPALRDREEDISLLAETFLMECNDRYSRRKFLTSQAMIRIMQYHWPGNVRQLRNLIHRAYIMADEVIELDELSQAAVQIRSNNGSVSLHLGTTIAEAERHLIHATLAHFSDDKKRAAETLGISLKTLYNRLNLYGRDK